MLGALFGRGMRSAGSVGRATTAARSASRIGKEQADVARATENAEVLQERMDALQAQFDAEVAALREPVAPDALEIQKRAVRPRKADIAIATLGLCWTP